MKEAIVSLRGSLKYNDDNYQIRDSETDGSDWRDDDEKGYKGDQKNKNDDSRDKGKN